MKFYIPFAVFLFITLPTLACDVCGNYMGITPYDNKHSISFTHRYRVFNGYKNYQQKSQFFPTSAYKTMHGEKQDSMLRANNNYSSNDFESFKIFDLRLKYFISKRLEANIFVPLINNKSKIDQYKTSTVGLGDVSVNLAYHVLTPKANEKFRNRLIVGLGLKTPTGNYYVHDKQSERIDFELQHGTGSWDGFSYINYVFMTNRLGFNLNVNYKVNGQNNYFERLGNAQNHFFNVFYKTQYKEFVFYPSIQSNYENTKGLYIKERLVKNSHMNSLLVGPGLDIYYKKVSFNVSWQFTAFETIEKGYLKSAGRFNIGLNYNFSTKKIE